MLLAGQNFKVKRRDIFRIRVELADNENEGEHLVPSNLVTSTSNHK